jgi:hypothetical protein
MAYSGKYKPKNQNKYKGNPDNVIFRSLWEKSVMQYLDANQSVLEWGSEEIIVPYVSVDGKYHRYFVDFFAKIMDKDGNVQMYLIEVKPERQTRPPKETPKRTKAYYKRLYAYEINKRKWEAAINFCEKRGWKFIILTERHIY